MYAIYSRVSTGLQVKEGTSLENQIELCKKKAKELMFDESLIKIYKEEGFTGEDIDRPALNDLRLDITGSKISHVIVTDPDRLSRNMIDKLIICNEFEKYSVQIIFVDAEYTNTPEGQLFFNMRSAIAEYELALIKKRTTRGRLKASEKLQKVMPMGFVPLGYEWKDCALIINERESEFVKKIYEWYVFDNLTMREIGERLYSHNVFPKSKKAKHWSASTIGRILSNETYIGNFYYNKKKSIKHKGQKTVGGNPKISYENRDRSEWVLVTVPAIIDEAIFYLAQEKKEKNLTRGGNIKNEYLLKSLIRCGKCGRTWDSTAYSGRIDKNTGIKKKYGIYRCGNKFPKKYGGEVYKCDNQSIRSDILDNYVWDMIVDVITDPKKYDNMFNKKDESAIQNIDNTIETLEKNIQTKEKEKEKIKIMFRREVISEEEMFKDIEEINKEIKKLTIQINKFQNHFINLNKEKLTLEKLNSFILSVQEMIEDEKELDFKKKKDIIDTLIKEVIIKIDGDNVTLTCVGTLEKIIKQDMFNDINSCTQLQHNRDTKQCSTSIVYLTQFKIERVGRESQLIEKDLSISIV